MATRPSSSLSPQQEAIQKTAVVCSIQVPEVPPFKLMLGRDEIEGTASFGTDPVVTALARGLVLNLPQLRLMLGMARPGQTVVDLGAHVGEFTMVAAAAGRRVLTVEASRRNQAVILGSLRVNGFEDRVELVCAAVSNQRGELWFREAGAFGAVVPPGNEAGVSAPAIPVGELLAVRTDSVGFIKIDVEGYEYEAFQGMAEWLKSSTDAPPILYESHLTGHQQRGRSVTELRRYLVELGYTHHYILYDDGILTPMDLEEAQPVVVGECLATRGPVVPPPGWKVGPPLNATAFIRLYTHDAKHFWNNPIILRGLGKEMAVSRGRLVRHPRVKIHLSQAARHPDATVREVFAPWKNCGGPIREMVELCHIAGNNFLDRLARELPRMHTIPVRLLRRLKRVRQAG